ncbi:spore coat protein CotJB [Phosphitispora sp. TUW77]|uniref:spore coat protein CotJB n=1 Tax=Phosphitispora sp. TUW77 TaxID=3152361 RepID=UPI003AB14B89
MNKKTSHQAKLLKEIMSYEFSAVELNLFLDTHPNDIKALAEYNQVTQCLKKLQYEYEKCYGPLMNFGSSFSQHPWRWIDEPWPWEIEY